ncbi:tetratricopeptide repeat protein [Bacteroidota bacterium]
MKTLRKAQAKRFRNYLILFISVFLFLNFPFNLNAQFAEESARAAYDLRMDGEILYARAMLQKLINQQKTEGGLVHYEMARTRDHQQLGGANLNPNGIITSTKRAVEEDPESVLFAVADAGARFGKAYVSMMQEGKTAGEDIIEAIESLEKVLKLDPDFHEVRVHLVEIYSQLPEDLAGDKEMAEVHASYLEEKDLYFGLLAREAMLPDSVSRVDFWKEKSEKNKKDTRIAVKLGKAYLLDGNIKEARPLFESAMNEDPKYNILLLHIARYHMYQVMWDQGKAGEELPLAETAIKQYLESEPEPIAPLKAWAIGKLATFSKFQGKEEEFDRLIKEAVALDPSFSKASGLPGFDLYVPPGEIYRSGDYETFLRPF